MEWLDRSIIVLSRYLILCTSEEDYIKVCKDIEYKEYTEDPWIIKGKDATVHYVDADGTELDSSLHEKKFAIVCIKINSKRTLIEIHGLLVHEAVHIWQDFHESIGEKFPSHEFEAYSIQWISQQLMWSFEDQLKKKKTNEVIAISDPIQIHNLD